MQNSQNTQNTADILMKKCSRCKKRTSHRKFRFQENTDLFKTCKRCRKQPNIDTNHSGSSNDHLNIVEVTENRVVEKRIYQQMIFK